MRVVPGWHWLRWLVLAAFAAGCATVSDVAFETAVQDLHCPASQVRVQETAYRQYLATGCGHYLRYTCIATGKANFKCVPDQPPQLRDIRDLQSPAPAPKATN